ncbi:hypothetical protein GH714_004239 [Hevea brasiliensis]|uniref:Reverse transcriptase Ty1/copia-type domain-containing protein n=1 Tax=Hevea brasiliensis TaxID=3981 RepID=A0A6A6LA41_HEVBR|nr:hypothetical protein GH714_004239 [Hevea brasiliensis]
MEVLVKFGMQNCNEVSTPLVPNDKLSIMDTGKKVDASVYRSLIGCLLYLSVTKPDAMYETSMLSRFMQAPSSCFILGSGMVSWSSKKQEIVAQSTVEAKYIAAASAVSQAIRLRKMLVDLKCYELHAIEILCDSKSALAMVKNIIFHGKTKHIKIKYHFLREVEREGEVQLIHCSSKNQVADILTKGLQKSKFEDFRERLGVQSSISVKEE